MPEEYQALANGTLEMGDFDPLLKATKLREILDSGLQTFGWVILNQEILHEGPAQLHRKLTIERGDEPLILNVFCFQVRGSSRNRPHEKRIQISRPWEDHRDEFNLDNNGPEKCLLLGIYKRGGVEVIVAYDKRNYLDHANPTSCYIDIGPIAHAMRDGFDDWIDSFGSVVNCFRKEMLPAYVSGIEQMHPQADGIQAEEAQGGDSMETAFPESDPPDHPKNLIVYGAPGTGKSWILNERVRNYFGDSRLHQRVTFYSDYTYGQFVGSYKPRPIYQSTETDLFDADQQTPVPSMSPIIDYRFVPGPFLDSVAQAILNPESNFVLVIEEINRADAASVFGDAFQMLDRDQAGASNYPCTLADEAMAFLRSRGIDQLQIGIPNNLYLWATMNSADQGVMPLDSAFKRRWSFEYMPLDKFATETQDWVIDLSFIDGSIRWNQVRDKINSKLIDNSVPEDRLIGPFFMTEGELNHNGFKNKLLMYLHDDVLRDDPSILFKDETLSAVFKSYDAGQSVFTFEL
jgi:hypothetical protein